tara:strand:- start:13548 stop:14309 length:762 start_codon:yes stop_codon:yes gene_type:complete
MSNIHPTAIIDTTASIAQGVTIGPYAVIGKNVSIGEGSVIGAHVQIVCNTSIGSGNNIFAFSVLGGDPAHKQHEKDDETWLEIGNNNIIHEYAVIHRGAKVCGGKTVIGNHNYIMCYVHIGHDCFIGDHVTMVNNVNLAGSVHIEDYAYLGAFSACVQRTRVGSSALLNPRMITHRNIMPYMIVEEKKVCGINKIGLERRGYSSNDIEKIRQHYRLICREGMLFKDVKDTLGRMECEYAKYLATFLDYGPVLR